jgi:hypothetical protein
MGDLRRRLQRLESAPCARPGQWPAEVEAAKQRAFARRWRRLGAALDTPTHPRVVWARTMLVDDPPEQAALDRDTLRRWGDAHPNTSYPETDGSRARLERKLDEIAARLEAANEP